MAVEIVSQDELAKLPELRKPKPRKLQRKAPEVPIAQKSPKQTVNSSKPFPAPAVRTVPTLPSNSNAELAPKPKVKPDAKLSLTRPKPKPKQLAAAPKRKPAPRPKKRPKFPLDKEKKIFECFEESGKAKKLSKQGATKQKDKMAKRAEQNPRRSQLNNSVSLLSCQRLLRDKFLHVGKFRLEQRMQLICRLRSGCVSIRTDRSARCRGSKTEGGSAMTHFFGRLLRAPFGLSAIPPVCR